MTITVENKIKLGIAAALVVLFFNALLSYQATRTLINNDQSVRQSYQVINELEGILSALKDIETGERGYVITGSDAFLEPYESAIPQIGAHIQSLKALTAENPAQLSRIPVLEGTIDERIEKVQAGIALRKAGQVEAANQLTASGEGKRLMDQVRQLIAGMEAGEDRLLAQRTQESRESQKKTILTFIIANLIACSVLLVTGVVIVNVIQARKRAEAEAQDAREKAEAANRGKDEFLAVLSHELRTPLTAIFGWVQLLHGGHVPDDKRTKALEVIDRNLHIQMQLIDDLLNVSQIITGKLSIRREMVDPLQVVRRAIDATQPSLDAKKISLRLEGDEAPAILADPARLQQVVWNLLSNAVKFTPAGGTVELQLRCVGSDLEIVVKDTGEGIRADFLPFVFNRFTQADSSSTRIHGGMGLGLALVRQLTQLQGGTVEVSSPGIGKGSTFTVRFPVPERSAAGSNTIALSGVFHETAGKLKGVRILVVDDEADARELIAQALQDSGASVTQAASAAEALRDLKRARTDILISDIAMADMNGYEFVSTLQKQADRPPVAIALTAHAGTADRNRAIEAGFREHLGKPVELSKLISVIEELFPERKTRA